MRKPIALRNSLWRRVNSPTPEDVSFYAVYSPTRIQIANADLALINGDTDQALSLLRQVRPDQRWVGLPVPGWSARGKLGGSCEPSTSVEGTSLLHDPSY